MAKKKKQVAEQVVEEITETVIEEEVAEEVVTEESIENISVAEEAVIEEPKKEDKSDQFYYTQLKIINKLNNPAKARRLAERVQMHRKQRGK